VGRDEQAAVVAARRAARLVALGAPDDGRRHVAGGVGARGEEATRAAAQERHSAGAKVCDGHVLDVGSRQVAAGRRRRQGAEPSTPPGAIDSASSGHYQSFDPAMRMPPTVKVRVVVGDDPSKAFMGLTLKQRDKVRKCMEMVMAGCDALLPENYDRDGYGLYKRRVDGTFVLLPLDAPLAVASLVEGDFVYVRECTEPRPKAETNERADTNGSADSTSSRRHGGLCGRQHGIEMLDSAVAELDDILASTRRATRALAPARARAAPSRTTARRAKTAPSRRAAAAA
jgi:hypothetical protein